MQSRYSWFVAILLLSVLFCGLTPGEDIQSKRQTLMNKQFQRELIRVTDRVYVAVGYGCSNSVMIVGEDSVIFVDAMYGTEEAGLALKAFRTVTDKPVQAIVYTHSHGDHTGGASVFAGDYHPVVIARPTPASRLEGYHRLNDILMTRAGHQFGIHIPLEQRLDGITMVYRPRGGIGEGYLKPTVYLTKERTAMRFSGIDLELVAAPGETDDQLYVWLPGENVLICGDNFYHSFPNLYAVRGTPYRDARQWVASLDKMLAEKPHALVPGHTRPVIGRQEVKKALGGYRDGIFSIWQQTLDGMNRGLSPDELAQTVTLPDSLKDHPYLQQYFGVIPWTVRSIYTGYMGWFDGNPTHLFPLSPQEKAQRIMRLLGSLDQLKVHCRQALQDRDWQWTCELADMILELAPMDKSVMQMKVDALKALAMKQISSNAKNYYLSSAMSMENRIKEVK